MTLSRTLQSETLVLPRSGTPTSKPRFVSFFVRRMHGRQGGETVGVHSRMTFGTELPGIALGNCPCIPFDALLCHEAQRPRIYKMAWGGRGGASGR